MYGVGCSPFRCAAGPRAGRNEKTDRPFACTSNHQGGNWIHCQAPRASRPLVRPAVDVAAGFFNPAGVRFIDGKLWVSDINGDFIAGKRELPDGFIAEIRAQ